MSSEYCFDYGKRTWKPKLNFSYSTIDVITSAKCKILEKEEYALKTGNVYINHNFVPFERSQLSEPQETRIKKPAKLKFEHTKDEDLSMCINIQFLQNKTQGTVSTNEYEISKETKTKISRISITSKQSGSSKQVPVPSFKNNSDYLLKKYWTMWKKFNKPKTQSVTVTPKTSSKSLKQSPTNRILTRQMSESDLTKHKQMILQQKQKIEEQANVIKELQLTRLELEQNKFQTESANLLHKISFDKTLKPKTKYLLNNVVVKKDPKFDHSWKFVSRMEERARQRREKWEAIKLRKQQMEEERMEKIRIQEEQRKQREEDEKKQKLLQAKMEKQRREEMKRKQKEDFERLQRLNLEADQYYHKHLLKQYFKSWKQHIYNQKLLMQQAADHYNQNVSLKYYITWKLYCKARQHEENEKADYIHRSYLLRIGFNGFCKILKERQRNIQAADDWYSACLQKNSFYQWFVFLCKQKKEERERLNQAERFHDRMLLSNCIACWKNYKEIHFSEIEKETRLRQLRNKVQEILPDFDPTSSNN